MNCIQGFVFLVLVQIISFSSASGSDPDPGIIRIIGQNGTSHTFSIELALTQTEQARGLMYRTALADDEGMLFLYSRPRMASFWMKNTYISLDMIFIRKDGIIENIIRNTQPLSLAPQQSTAPVLAVLELVGGRSDALGIQAGDRVEHPMIR